MAEDEKAAQDRQKRAALDLEEAELEARLKATQMELEAKRMQKNSLAALAKNHDAELARERAHRRTLRGVGEA